MAFVGGHKKHDERTPWEVAQREYEEETSHPKAIIEFMGYLPVVMTARLQPIIPVLAQLHFDTDDFLFSAKSNGEWDDIIAYPWKELMHENHWEYAWRTGYSKSPIMFHTLRSKTYKAQGGNLHPHLLWGATAGMIWDFLRLYFNAGK